MIQLLKQSTARNLSVYMVDSADHFSGKTGLTLTINASKDGAAFAAITPTVTELANGWYSLALTTAHTNTLGDLILHITGTGADPTPVACQVIAIDLADAVRAGLTALPNAAAEAAGGLYTRGSGAGQINQPANGQIDSNAVKWAGTATTLTSGLPDVNMKTITAGIIAAASFAANALDAVWSTATRVLTAGTNIALAKGTGVTGFTDLDAAGVRSAVGLATANLDTQVAAVKTDTAAIKLKTDNLPSDPADASDILGATNAIFTAVGTRLAASSYAAPDNTSIAAIKAKTDNLPASPAATSDIPVANITAIKAKTDNLPSNPAAQTVLDTINTKLGAPVGASLSADIAGIRTVVNALPGGEILRNTALTFPFPMSAVLLSVSSQFSLDGSSWANTTNSVVEIGGKLYKLDLTAGETNGKCLLLKFSSTGNPDVIIELITAGAY